MSLNTGVFRISAAYLAATLLIGCSPTIREVDEFAIQNAPATPVQSNLSISPDGARVEVHSTEIFSATGGLAPYSFELIAGVGSISSSGTYNAGAIAGSAIIRVTDASGRTGLTSALVYAPVELAPTSKTVLVNESFAFVGVNGVSPHVFSIASGSGTIHSETGLYTAPAGAGSAVVRVTDSIGGIATASVTINPALQIGPTAAELAVNNSSVFTASGGVPPYSFAVTSGGGTVGALSGYFTAPAAAGTTVVTLTDSAGHASTASITVRAAVSLSPASKTLAPANTGTFTASNGVPPYTYSVAFGGGNINASTGLYTAPGAPGSAVVHVTDSRGNVASADVVINPALAISPSAAALGANGTTTFSASGGLAPYTFSVTGSGTIHPTSGAYTAPAIFGNDTVTVTDSLGNTSTASVAISGALSISPGISTVAIQNVINFAASGGVAPYSYSISSGGGSIIAATGQYTAPNTAGTATVRVTDSALNTSDATITINPGLVISPATDTLSLGNSRTFSASGGVGAYTFSVSSGGGSVDAGTGVFTAPASTGTSTVAVTDGIGNVSTATVTVTPALSVTPATKYVVISSSNFITPSGGVPPYAFAVTSGPGSIDPGTGVFSAPAVTGQTTVIQVTDSLANTTSVTAISVKPVKLASAINSACALMDNGTVQCWGANDRGQLGNGTLKDSSYPVQVQNLTGAVDIEGAMSGSFFCALISDGTIQCWGENANGQMGFGITGSTQSLPVQVAGISTATAISLGTAFSCALLSDTSVQCWGANGYGQYGNGNTTSSYTPVAAYGGVTNVTSLALGASYSCIALSDGSARCAGANAAGQLGNNSNVGATTPQVVLGAGSIPISNVSQVFTGQSFTCALSAGTLLCWGSNGYGQLGLGNTTEYWVAQDTGIADASEIVVGAFNVCATFGTPALKCWGYGGAVGDGTSAARSTPTAVTGLTAAASLTSNGSYSGCFTCALQASGQIQCWGSNSNGQLGTGTSYSVTRPETVLNLPSVTALATGPNHSCALLQDKTIKCWGYNNNGQLGDGTTTDRLSPVPVPGINNAVAIDAGWSYTCALLADATVKCWGYNSYGQLGDGTNVTKSAPVAVSGLSNVSAISAGYYHACAKLTDGSLKCWGFNNYGQVGDNTTVNKLVPTSVLGLPSPIVSFFASKGSSDRHTTCATLDTGIMKCWGSNNSGQLGNGNQTNQGIADTVLNLSQVTRIADSGISTCAAVASGELYCWGENNTGQLGNGSTVGTAIANSTVLGILNPVSIAMGVNHSCALDSVGDIYCWGGNSRGQIGNGMNSGTFFAPLLVSNTGSKYVSVQAASSRTCALTDAGVAKCWGANYYGEAGVGVAGNDIYVPVSVIFR